MISTSTNVLYIIVEYNMIGNSTILVSTDCRTRAKNSIHSSSS